MAISDYKFWKQIHRSSYISYSNLYLPLLIRVLDRVIGKHPVFILGLKTISVKLIFMR